MTDQYAYYDSLRQIIDDRLATVIDRREPLTMYDPARYVLEGGGKRIRPVLVLLACEAAGGKVEQAVDAGVAVEILHNFTLVHDDIMDNSATRRGRDTVHRKWDENVAILVGDGLIGVAYRVLLQTASGDVRRLTQVFTEGMIEVCEGQSYDKEFELRPSVTEDEYLMMIGKKTGWLVKISAELGGVIAGATPEHMDALLRYARHIGRAFQIQDDLLDVVADQDTLGKPVGGDILEGKKTYLLVKAMGLAEGDDLSLLRGVATRTASREDLVERVRDVYDRTGVLDIARERVAEDTQGALLALQGLPEGRGRDMLDWLAHMLLERKH